VQSFLSEKKA